MDGLIVEFDESGNELRRATATIPQSYKNNHTTNRAYAAFNVAFKTPDGGYLAFGTLRNVDAPVSEKQYSWKTGDFAQSDDLVTGVWIVKFDANLQVVKNILARGRSVIDGWLTNDNTFLIGGFDASRDENQNPSYATTNITLLRKYDQNGNLIKDLRRNDREISSIYKYPDGSFVATTPDRLLQIDATASKISVTSMNSEILPGSSNYWIRSVSPAQDGGVFICTNLNSSSHSYTNYMNGSGFYKLSNLYKYVYSKLNKPADTIFMSPLLLPGTTSKYVGTATVQKVSNSTVEVAGNRIYELTDNGVSAKFRIGDSYPDGTSLRAVSQVDGFFSCGRNANGQAAIAKLSTCANFKLDAGATNVGITVHSDTAVFSGRTVAYTGEKGNVSYVWTLTDITPGGPATDVLTTVTGEQNTAIPKRTFTIRQGRASALLRYTVTAVDSYRTEDGIPQTCQQTQNILLRINNLPDNLTDTDCAVPVTAMDWKINMNPAMLGNDSVSVYQTPYIGDLDGDGHVEIVVAKSFAVGGGGGNSGQSSWSYFANGIFVFDRKNNTHRLITTPVFATQGIGQIGLAKPGVSEKGLIVIAAMDGYLYAYHKNSANYEWKSKAVYTTLEKGKGIGFNSASVMFADFNGDGYAEIVTGDRIFDLKDGELLLDCGFLNKQDIRYPVVSVTDVNGDGKPELVWGGNVYDINIFNRKGTSGNTFVQSSWISDNTALNGLPNTSVRLTAPIDIDLDGNVDILAYGYSYFYIYNPLTGAVKVRMSIPANDRGDGVPFVGDIDGDKYPEIMYGETENGLNIIAYDIDSAGLDRQSATVKWKKRTTDQSKTTGLTLFDFNQDETFEILYRDQDSLRIFNGYSQATMNVSLASMVCQSGTLAEYPVTADVDNDGEAEIIVTGTPPNTTTNERGYVYIFNPPTGTRWAPARKVWNQYAYNVVNINEDLTVPAKMFNIATIMAGKDSIVGSVDDIQPFNGFLKQSTMINSYGNMIMYASDAAFADMQDISHDAGGDCLTLRFRVTNNGKSALHPPFYLAAYKDGISPASAMATESVNAILLAGDTMSVTVTVRNFSRHLPLSNIIVAVNDGGKASFVQTECDYGNNTESINVLALADIHTAYCNNPPDTIAVAANDIIPSTCTVPEVSIVYKPAHVTAKVDDNKIVYSSNLAGTDTLVYRVRCGSDSCDARLLITVTGNAFVDDVWYFGQNAAGAGSKSAGIRFVKNASGQYVAQDASGELNVYSWANSLVVSSPYCNGHSIFYASHDNLYNSVHQKMMNGNFNGHASIADGLAACYMGDNKYLFFTVTARYSGTPRALKAYIVDMNADNGMGRRSDIEIKVEDAGQNMSETIILTACAGTPDKYWLIYPYCNNKDNCPNSNEMRVRLIDPGKPVSSIVGPVHSRCTKTVGATYSIAASQKYDRIATVNANKTIDVFDFNNSTGTISLRCSTPVNSSSDMSGVEFSPDGNQLYATEWNGKDARLYQYDLSVKNNAAVLAGSIQFWRSTQSSNDKGGGLKLGPDNRIYVTQSYTNKVGVISNPDDRTAPLASRYNMDALELDVVYTGLQFSTGLTKPAIMQCNANAQPVTLSDVSQFCVSPTSKTATVNVLINDSDVDPNDVVYLTNAGFVNDSDNALADITVNAADSTVSLNIKSGAYIGVAGHVFDIVYSVKDNGLPASQCATGSLRITAYPTPVYPDIRVRVCPDAGGFNLAKYVDTADKITNIQWTSQSGIPVSSPDGAVSTNNFRSQGVHSFTYTVQSRCVDEQKRKVYVEVLKNRTPSIMDTIAICHKYTEAMLINQLFGIEAAGVWTYPDIPDYISESSNGAVVMNGKAIYEKNLAPGIYRGKKVNMIQFTYTPNNSGCLKHKIYKMTIALTQ
jgi:hypothetical protein